MLRLVSVLVLVLIRAIGPPLDAVGWNTKLQARETNYGTRVDYLLATQGLLQWIKHADIQPGLKGSDHCPVFVDLHDEIALASGETVRLCDVLTRGAPPRIAAANWEEFSGRQTLLSSFFGKRPPGGEEPAARAESEKDEAATSAKDEEKSRPLPSLAKPPASPARKRLVSRTPSSSQASPSGSGKKRAHTSSASSASSSKKKAKTSSGQATLGSFFGKTQPKSKPPASSPEVPLLDEDSLDDPSMSSIHLSTPEELALAEQLDADYRLACELSASEDASLPLPLSLSLSPSSSASSSTTTKAAWTTLFAPRDPPKCTVHGEPAKMYTVNKQGPNKGRTFYICSRCVFVTIGHRERLSSP